jgi:hypothetical protein
MMLSTERQDVPDMQFLNVPPVGKVACRLSNLMPPGPVAVAALRRVIVPRLSTRRPRGLRPADGHLSVHITNEEVMPRSFTTHFIMLPGIRL